MDLLLDMIQEGEIGDSTLTCAKEQAFNTDIERLAMDCDAHVRKAKSGNAKQDVEKDILEYWNQFRYGAQSKLPDLACDLLVIPASSVPSERMFSIAGLLSSGIFVTTFIDVIDIIVTIAGKMHKISAENLQARVLLRCNQFD